MIVPVSILLLLLCLIMPVLKISFFKAVKYFVITVKFHSPTLVVEHKYHLKLNSIHILLEKNKQKTAVT